MFMGIGLTQKKKKKKAQTHPWKKSKLFEINASCNFSNFTLIRVAHIRLITYNIRSKY